MALEARLVSNRSMNRAFKRASQTVALSLTLASFAAAATAAQVSFWFSGVIKNLNVASNVVPSGIAEGTPFTGCVAYDSSGWSSTNLVSFPTGQIGDYYFHDMTKMQLVVQMGWHTFINSNSPSGYNCGQVEVVNQFNNNDAFYAETASASLVMDGATWLAFPDSANWAVYLKDLSKVAYSSVAIPTNAPTLAQFPDSPELGLYAYGNDGQDFYFSVNGPITNITSTEQVMLNIRRTTPTHITLAWPAVANGFKLQSRGNLSTGNWQDVIASVIDDTSDHTATVATGGTNTYFRLKK